MHNSEPQTTLHFNCYSNSKQLSIYDIYATPTNQRTFKGLTALRERANLGSIVKSSLAEGTTVRHEKQGTHRTRRKAENTEQENWPP